MSAKVSFFTSLEKYAWRVGSRSPLSYPWIIVGLGLVVVLTSLAGRSLAGVTGLSQAIERAALVGDYALAERLYQLHGADVLGANTKLESLVYPERVVEQRIVELEEKQLLYPGNRELYTLLSSLYLELGNQEMSNQYGERARILDPNR